MKTDGIDKKGIVSFHLLPETSKEDQERVYKITDFLCEKYDGTCALPICSPFKITIVSAQKRKPVCSDGWFMIYEFKTPETALQFSEDIALLKPICGIDYQ